MPTRVAQVLVAALLTLGLAACGDDPDDEPTTDPTSDTSASSDPTDTATPDTATSDSVPSVEPATGEVVELNALRIRLVERDDWIIQRVGTTVVALLDGDTGTFQFSGGGIGTTATDLDEGAEVALDVESAGDVPLERLPNRTIGGVECYVLEGASDEDRRYLVGGFHEGFRFDLEFEEHLEWPDAEATIESMLASIEWK